MSLRIVLANLSKKDSTTISHDPCFGVKTNSNLPGRVTRYPMIFFRKSMKSSLVWVSWTKTSIYLFRHLQVE